MPQIVVRAAICSHSQPFAAICSHLHHFAAAMAAPSLREIDAVLLDSFARDEAVRASKKVTQDVRASKDDEEITVGNTLSVEQLSIETKEILFAYLTTEGKHTRGSFLGKLLIYTLRGLSELQLDAFLWALLFREVPM